MYCTFCGSNLHSIKNCPKTWGGQGNRNNMHCSYCGSNKHNINACPKTWNGSSNVAWHQDKIEDDHIMD
jgi:primosomal protein N'